MAILILEEPFKSLWKKAYIRTSKDGRSRVDLVNDSVDRTTISYARYLLSVKIGRLLTEDEEADHINSDETDDRIDNLQVLSKKEHLEKTLLERPGRKYHKVICSYCAASFNVPPWKYISRSKFLCSRSCNAKWNRENTNWCGNTGKVTQEQKESISTLINEGKTNYAISKLLNINIGSVAHYRRSTA